MSDCNRILLIDICQKGTFVVDAEVEDAVLVWDAESGCERGRVGAGSFGGREMKTVVGVQHGEFELERVGGR